MKLEERESQVTRKRVDGKAVEDLQSVSYSVINEENGTEVGSGNIGKTNINFNIHGAGEFDIETMAEGLEKLFNGEG